MGKSNNFSCVKSPDFGKFNHRLPQTPFLENARA
jgi:hypothetical protein